MYIDTYSCIEYKLQEHVQLIRQKSHGWISIFVGDLEFADQAGDCYGCTIHLNIPATRAHPSPRTAALERAYIWQNK